MVSSGQDTSAAAAATGSYSWFTGLTAPVEAAAGGGNIRNSNGGSSTTANTSTPATASTSGKAKVKGADTVTSQGKNKTNPLFEVSRRIKTRRNSNEKNTKKQRSLSPSLSKIGGRDRRKLLGEERQQKEQQKQDVENNKKGGLKGAIWAKKRRATASGDVDETRGEANSFSKNKNSGNTTSDRSSPPSPVVSMTKTNTAAKSEMTIIDTTIANQKATTGTGSVFRGDVRQKKIVYKEYSNNPMEDLQLEISDIPDEISLQDDHVVVKIMASTVSLQDCMIRKGVAFGQEQTFPLTPGMDIVGNVISCGKKVKGVHVGDRVATLVRVGGNARYISVPGSSLTKVPRSVDPVEAACLVTTYMTAYQTIRKVTRDTFNLEGKRVLVTGSTEPVGQALIQLCLRAGALEIYATAPTSSHQYVKKVLGATPLPTDPEEWLPVVKGKMNLVFDRTCQDGDLSSPYDALKYDGILVCLGMTSLLGKESSPSILGPPLSAYFARLRGHLIPNAITYDVCESFSQDPNAFKLDLEILFHLLKKKFIKPHIAKRISLLDVPTAQKSLEEGECIKGEILCLPWKKGKVMTSKTK